MDHNNEDKEEVVPDAQVEELEDTEEDAQAYQLESLRQEAGLGHITPEMRRELFNRFLEFETLLSTCTVQQQTFVLAYIQDPTDATKAGRLAGYAESGVKPHVSRLLRNDKIAHLIALGNNLREDRTFITADRTIQELAIIGFSDITDYEVHPDTGRLRVVEGAPRHATRAVASAEFKTVVEDIGDGKARTTFTTKIKLWNKVDTLRMLALYQKLMRPDSHVTINNTNEAGSKTTWVFGDKEITV